MAYAPRPVQWCFDHAPPFVKGAIAGAYQLRHRWRYGAAYHEQRRRLAEGRTYSAARARLEQAAMLERYFAQPAIAGYARALGVSLRGDPFTVLERFPVIERARLRELAVTHRDPHVRAVLRSTSGTTGSPLVLPIAREAIQREYAFVWDHRSWRGVERVDPVATVAGHPVVPIGQGAPPFWLRVPGANNLLLSSYHLREDRLRGYLDALAAFAPALLHGYPSSLDVLARAALDAGVRIRVGKAVYTGSESLLPAVRARLEEAFGVKVSNWYGNTEQCANIVECPEGRLHQRWEHSYVEWQPDGQMICTAFLELAMPIVRYRLSDVVTLSPEQRCPCGHAGRIVASIDGRIEDYVLGKDGTRFGRLDHIFKTELPIVEARLVQERPGAVRIEVVARRPLTRREQDEVEHELHRRVGDDFDVEWRAVATLPRGPSGKLRFIEQRCGNVS